MYKPHTIEQYKVYRFLEENFALEHFLLAPLSRFGLMLEDKTGEKIAFAFLNNCVQEIPVPAPAAPETVTAFLKQFRSLTPHPVVHDFEALTGFVKSMPIAIEEAAMIDGCNPIQIFFKVVCPILKPTMISTAIFCPIL